MEKSYEFHMDKSNNPLLEFTSKVHFAENSEQLISYLVEAISPFGYEKFAYARSPVQDAGVEEYISLKNLDSDWMEFYITNEIYKDDPLILHCMESMIPYRWVNFEQDISEGKFSAAEINAIHTAREWGVSNGVTIPLPCFGRYHAGISLVADPNSDHQKQDKIFQENENIIVAIVQAFHAAVDVGTIARDYFGLSKREVEVLKMQSDGLRTKEIATQLDTSPHTVEKQAKSARERLFAASSAEAVAKAVLLGIID